MLPWGGLSCCLSGAALYLLGRSSGRDAEILKSATRINQLKELDCHWWLQFRGELALKPPSTAEQHFFETQWCWLMDTGLCFDAFNE
ncbi:uncharacterized protein [Pyrus communis]|uniref:uncharacterized protein isoform X7 n=1 Tax=Pyrus communis TaxID=23211 RepID=UPI0035BEFE42